MTNLGIKITKERRSSLFLNAKFKYAKVIHVMEKTIGSIETPLKTPASAHGVIVHALSLLPNEDNKILSASHKTLFNDYAKQHGIDTTELLTAINLTAHIWARIIL